MNQLQNLLHDALIETGHVAGCALVRRKDSHVAASSVGFNFYPEQVQLLSDAFRNPSHTRSEGLLYAGKTYQCIRADRNAIYAKLEGSTCGLILIRTASLLIVAVYADNMHPSVCVEACEKLADYFREKGK